MGRVLAWFRGLSAREQRAVLIGLATGVALLLLAVLLPLERQVGRLEQRVQAKRADLAWLQGVAPQLGALQATNFAADNESLVVLVDRVAREAGIAGSLTSQSGGDGSLSVRVEQVPFDILVNWTGELVQRHGVRVISASIDAGNSPGLVSASLQLAAP